MIAISAVLLLFDFADVTIGKIGVMGTDLVVGDVRVLMWTAWILWAYFLLRYYQYWRMQDKQAIRQAFRDRMKHYSNAYWYGHPTLSEKGNVTGTLEYVAGLKWQFNVSKYVAEEGGFATSYVPVSFWQSTAWTMRAAWYVLAHTHHATDHVLPFALAIAAPLVTFVPRLFDDVPGKVQAALALA